MKNWNEALIIVALFLQITLSCVMLSMWVGAWECRTATALCPEALSFPDTQHSCNSQEEFQNRLSPWYFVFLHDILKEMLAVSSKLFYKFLVSEDMRTGFPLISFPLLLTSISDVGLISHVQKLQRKLRNYLEYQDKCWVDLPHCACSHLQVYCIRRLSYYLFLAKIFMRCLWTVSEVIHYRFRLWLAVCIYTWLDAQQENFSAAQERE